MYDAKRRENFGKAGDALVDLATQLRAGGVTVAAAQRRARDAFNAHLSSDPGWSSFDDWLRQREAPVSDEHADALADALDAQGRYLLELARGPLAAQTEKGRWACPVV
jgi:hypothetical protein